MKTVRLLVAGLLAAAPAWAQPPGANYDEAKVPAYALPDPLRFADGAPVTDAGGLAGAAPPRAPAPLREARLRAQPRTAGGDAFRGRRVEPARARRPRHAPAGARAPRRHGERPGFEILLYVPNAARRPVPAFLGLNFGGNHAVHPDPGIRLSTAWMGDGPGVAEHRATEAARGTNAASWPIERILDRGYALATVVLRRPRARPRRWLEGRRSRPDRPGHARAASPPTTGGRSAPGPGASAARSITWRPTRTWTAAASP